MPTLGFTWFRDTCTGTVCGHSDFLDLYHPVSMLSPTQDATEIMADSCGRWFSFNVTLDTVMILEKKNLADHVASLPCVDSPTPLSTIIRQLEDAGEVWLENS